MGFATLPSTEFRDKALAATSRLPPFSPVLNKLMASLSNEHVSIGALSTVIENDMVLAGAVLRLVNSAYYGRRGTVNSVKQAVWVLGLDKLRGICMAMSLARMWNSAGLPPGWCSRSFNRHAVASAIMADQLAVNLNVDYAEGAFTAALLQNVGLLLIALGIPSQYAEVIKAYQTGTGELCDYEAGYVGVSHAELSGEVLNRWHLPLPIVEAVTRHHGPHQPGKEILSPPLSRLVELADLMVGQQGVVAQPWMSQPSGTPAEVLTSQGLDDMRASSILAGFTSEYGTIKGYFV